MNDLLPYRHGDEGEGSTHSVCNTRLAAEGGKSRCCYCRPHKGCDFDAPQSAEGEAAPCKFCGGTGKVKEVIPHPEISSWAKTTKYGQPCPDCGGSGHKALPCNCGNWFKGHSLRCPRYYDQPTPHPAADSQASAEVRGEKLYTVNGADEVQFHDGTTLKVDPEPQQPKTDAVDKLIHDFTHKPWLTPEQGKQRMNELIRTERVSELEAIRHELVNAWTGSFYTPTQLEDYFKARLATLKGENQ